MKIALTGHTKGIGQATYNLLTKQGHEVVGYSRHNGWDFTNSQCRVDFIKELKNEKFDCFINNAYPHKFYQNMEGFFQIELLNQAWLLWEKDVNKKIIVIGSYNADSAKGYFHPYNVHKKALNETCQQLRNTRAWPHIINIKPSYVDTQVISHLNNVTKSSPESVAELILWALNSPYKVYDLSFGAYDN